MTKRCQKHVLIDLLTDHRMRGLFRRDMMQWEIARYDPVSTFASLYYLIYLKKEEDEIYEYRRECRRVVAGGLLAILWGERKRHHDYAPEPKNRRITCWFLALYYPTPLGSSICLMTLLGGRWCRIRRVWSGGVWRGLRGGSWEVEWVRSRLLPRPPFGSGTPFASWSSRSCTTPIARP